MCDVFYDCTSDVYCALSGLSQICEKQPLMPVKPHKPKWYLYRLCYDGRSLWKQYMTSVSLMSI